jgi:HEAT repeat protein
LLVKRIDPQALSKLSDELRSPERQRRRRGLQLVAAMQAIPELHTDISLLLHDEDEFLRADAIRAVAECDIPESRAALRPLLTDSSALVRQAAEEALAQLSKPKNRATFPTLGSNMTIFDSLPDLRQP